MLQHVQCHTRENVKALTTIHEKQKLPNFIAARTENMKPERTPDCENLTERSVEILRFQSLEVAAAAAFFNFKANFGNVATNEDGQTHVEPQEKGKCGT